MSSASEASMSTATMLHHHRQIATAQTRFFAAPMSNGPTTAASALRATNGPATMRAASAAAQSQEATRSAAAAVVVVGETKLVPSAADHRHSSDSLKRWVASAHLCSWCLQPSTTTKNRKERRTRTAVSLHYRGAAGADPVAAAQGWKTQKCSTDRTVRATRPGRAGIAPVPTTVMMMMMIVVVVAVARDSRAAAQMAPAADQPTLICCYSYCLHCCCDYCCCGGLKRPKSDSEAAGCRLHLQDRPSGDPISADRDADSGRAAWRESDSYSAGRDRPRDSG